MARAAGLSVSSGPTHLARPWSATAPDAASSSCPTIRASSTNCATSSGSMSIRPHTPSSCRSTKRGQIQALDRTQPGLPLKKGLAGTMTHDYERHGTTTLFAAMNVLDGTVIGRNMQRHRHQEFIRFLNVIEKQVPAGKTITPSSTITPPISIPMFADGSNAIRDGPSISPRHRPLGSTPSRASSQPSSQSEGSSAASFAPSLTYKPRSTASSKSTISYRRPSLLDRRSRQNHRRSQARAPSVRFDPTLVFAVSKLQARNILFARDRAFPNRPPLGRAEGTIMRTTVDHALIRRVGYRRTGNASRSFLCLGSSVRIESGC